MLTSTLAGLEFALDHPDIVGTRVLVTGASSDLGVEVTRLFADHRVRLVLQADHDSREFRNLAARAGKSALAVETVTGCTTAHADAVRVARAVAQTFGGLDVVINIVRLGEFGDTARDVERAVGDLLALPTIITRVVANRMRTGMIEGTILNVLASPVATSARQRAMVGIARTALASLTRGEAAAWGPHGIRINAIAPPTGLVAHRGDCLTSMPDVASLALHLASERGSRLSGLVLEGWCG